MSQHGTFPEPRLQTLALLYVHVCMTLRTERTIQHASLRDDCGKEQVVEEVLRTMLRMIVVEYPVATSDEYSTSVAFACHLRIAEVRGPNNNFVSVRFEGEANLATITGIGWLQSLANVFRPEFLSGHFAEILFQNPAFKRSERNLVGQYLLGHHTLLCCV